MCRSTSCSTLVLPRPADTAGLAGYSLSPAEVLAGYSLSPAEVLAADQRLTDRALALREAGLPGALEELRARAYLDTLLGRDSNSSP